MDPPRRSSRKTISPIRFGFEKHTVLNDTISSSGSVEFDYKEYCQRHPSFVPGATLTDGSGRFYTAPDPSIIDEDKVHHLKKKDVVFFLDENGKRIEVLVVNVTKKMARVKIFKTRMVVLKKKTNLYKCMVFGGIGCAHIFRSDIRKVK